MKEKFYNGTYDEVFKRIMKNKRYLVKYLKEILDKELEEEDIELYDTEIGANIKDKKYNLDVRFKIHSAIEGNIEMQKNDPSYNMIRRLVLHATQLFTPILRKGEGYKEMEGYTYNRGVIVICICDYPINKKLFQNEITLYDNDKKIMYGELLKIIVLDLTKLNQCDKIELKEILEVLKADEEKIKKLEGAGGIVSEIAKDISTINEDDIAREILRQEFNRKLDELEEKRCFEEQTIARVTKEVTDKVKKDTIKDVAKNMKNMGIDSSVIKEATGLDIDIIEKL